MRNLKASTSQLMTNNNNNNNKVYTPLSEKCSQSRVFINIYENKTDYYLNLNELILHYEAHRSKLHHSQYYLC